MEKGKLTSAWKSLCEVQRCPANQVQAHKPGDTECGVELRLRQMLERLNDNLIGAARVLTESLSVATLPHGRGDSLKA